MQSKVTFSEALREVLSFSLTLVKLSHFGSTQFMGLPPNACNISHFVIL